MKDVKIMHRTHFKGKFTMNVKNVSKNYTIFSLDSEKVST